MDKNRKVIKTGNSLALTIPNKIIKSFDIKEGDLAQYKISSSKTSITYTFSGHPRQLSLGYAEK
ncbi:MAG TPA: AbrB/MazE/SpoVT family DNA-binding domain-containing protein [Candidatus Woesebacteria bacterium]|nr:AbrB/MazE/SpoVT family DNA-binding domain-containing protein [Candidatus Woesebacteria bacterium]HOY60896.1 AbrB/MazE/SpoVT family DNA-binding domain-containing protein [Candidatus Woesebacteria bacterium]HPR99296.1 AbrB/MazE/SpoVT family DNA-binding domain-containing protein [Candidatus Woesebacteria bacterium]